MTRDEAEQAAAGDAEAEAALAMWPDCAVCGRLVDEVRVYRDAVRSAWVCEARCHGKVEKASLGDEMFHNGPLVVTSSVAFERPRALPAPGAPS